MCYIVSAKGKGYLVRFAGTVTLLLGQFLTAYPPVGRDRTKGMPRESALENFYMVKEAGAFAKMIRRYIRNGEISKAEKAVAKMNYRSGGAVNHSILESSVSRAANGDPSHLNRLLGQMRRNARNAPTVEDYVPRMIDGRVNPTYLNAMRQSRSGRKGAMVSQASGGTAEHFDHLMRGGVASGSGSRNAHLQLSTPGINLRVDSPGGSIPNANRGVWTVPRDKGGRTPDIERYARLRSTGYKHAETPSVIHFDMPKALVADEAALKRMARSGQFMGGASTGGVEALLPGPVVRKFGRNFRQKRAGDIPEELMAESSRASVGKAPSKRAVDMPWAVDARRAKGRKSVQDQRSRYIRKNKLDADQVDLLDDMSVTRPGQALDPYFDPAAVDPRALPTKMRKRLKKMDLSELEFMDGGDQFIKKLRS